MKVYVFALMIMLFSLVSFGENRAIKVEQYVLSQKTKVQDDVNQIIEKQVAKIKVPLDFQKLSCLESEDQIQRANSPLVHLGVCLIAGKSKSVPEVSGTFVILISNQGLSVQPLNINQE